MNTTEQNFDKILATFQKKCDFRVVQRSALCKSRRELSNAHLLENFRFDTAENEPCKVNVCKNEPSASTSSPSSRHRCCAFSRTSRKSRALTASTSAGPIRCGRPAPAHRWAGCAHLNADRARSRLYRSEILKQDMRLKALAEIYTMHSFAQLCNLNFFVKNLPTFLLNLKFCKFLLDSANLANFRIS